MKTLMTAAAALAVVLVLPTAADAQNGNGNGNGNGKGRGEDSRQQGRGGGEQDRGQGRGGDARARAPQTSEVRQENRGPGQGRGQENSQGRGQERAQERGRAQADAVRAEVRRVERPDDRPGVVTFRDVRDRGLVAGCPPGLARKNNGCLPPGQARQIARRSSPFDSLWARQGDGYRYEDGNLYRTNPQGSLMGWLPMLGGALTPGATWPNQYQYQSVPAYYSDYYRLNDRYDYRYANGVVYGVDPQTQAIGQVAALLTGQQFNVGQPMPAGYDVYNVPHAYRDRYADSANSMYRYNDGQVYQVDPTTRLVQAVIQLLV